MLIHFETTAPQRPNL